jgi:hypothetical protein
MTQEQPAQPVENQQPPAQPEADAAASLAEAFTKLRSGEPISKLTESAEPPPSDPPPPESKSETSTEQKTEAGEDTVVPTAEAISKMRGRKSKKAPENLEGPPEAKSSDDTDEMPREADSLKKWAVNMKKDWKAEKAKREELEAKLADIEKSKVEFNPEEVERLKKIVDEQERELTLSRVEATNEFKESVVRPMQQIRDLASQLAKKYELKESEVIEALSEKDPSLRTDKISDLTSSMNDADKWTLYEAQRRYAKIENVREKVVNNAKAALEKVESYRQEQLKQQQEESQKQYAQNLSKIWAEAQEAVPLLKPVEGDDEWNNQLQQAQQFAQQVDLASLTPDASARVAIRSAVAPLIYGQFVALFNQYQQMEKALEKYQSATPKAGGGASVPAVETKAEFDDFLEAIKANLK